MDITYLTAGLRGPFQPRIEAWERYAHIDWVQVADLIRSTWSSASDPRVQDVLVKLLDGITHLDEPAREWWSRLGYRVEPVVAVEVAEPHPSAPSGPATTTTAEAGAAALQEGFILARATAEDGLQRAIGLESGGLEALHELRLGLRRACLAERPDSLVRRVQPWLWSAATSGGKAMTAAGLRTGYEVRISRTRSVRSTPIPEPGQD